MQTLTGRLAELRDGHGTAIEVRGPERVALTGPDLALPPQSAVSLAMLIHELSTNARKYGALSTDEGRIAVTWSTEGHGPSRLLRIDWRESGGPPVTAPVRRGFGTRLIEPFGGRRQPGDARIPAGRTALHDYEPPGGRTMMELTGLSILVLEDEPIIAMALEENLELAGAKPLVAGSLEHAAELIAEERIDAAILDINVHGRKSYETAAALAAMKVPFIFASGYGDTLHETAFAGVPTVTKPYDLVAIRKAFASTAIAERS